MREASGSGKRAAQNMNESLLLKIADVKVLKLLISAGLLC